MTADRFRRGGELWRDRAREMSALAEDAKDSGNRAIVLRVAADFDLLAQAEEAKIDRPRVIRASWDPPVHVGNQTRAY